MTARDKEDLKYGAGFLLAILAVFAFIAWAVISESNTRKDLVNTLDRNCKAKFGNEYEGRGALSLSRDFCVNTKTGEDKYL